jgi:hypothetical protein
MASSDVVSVTATAVPTAKAGVIQMPQQPDVENTAVQRIYANFDDFFHQYALANNVPLEWKVAVKMHIQDIGCTAPEDWLRGIKHFGL